MVAEIKTGKGRKWSITSKGTPAANVKILSRWLPCLFGPYAPLTNMKLETAKWLYNAFEYLLKELPFIRLVSEHLKFNAGALFLIAGCMDHHARAGRSSHLNAIRADLDRCLPKITLPSGEILAPLAANELLAQRNFGFNTLCMGRLNVPIEDRAEFDENPKAYCDEMTAPGARRHPFGNNVYSHQ
ncbi:uncharacterized protein BXZ73DRAFT_106202 [Epithele typhae]|uniref:uncharacterized protein n=1 Tax=Epithele typhae TaxID=378194 RepID=UPI002007C23D|nr:uncharacterized protein BXZ73DRAFT_106202 [Epithele typhae]KAH9915473.1 hypothetical protein BXZ73DRAFT_106202 [Epithele typhae]